ncbi:hypothetical protein B0J13DRAFT_589819 [Dactylonectria estremocensis]|uniref:Uncharacterized protein n=1 Tax=Dactylonectria estremocensis TaxID=1079267 RepID=A0A9P9DJN0_9HYPO|nr:hypothetical protein B0J13DRAFT_589819 [Dactylonectria estremocensis]
MDGHHRAVRTMLGGHTVARFTSLEFEQRRAIFRKHLVQRKPVIIGEGDGDDSLNPDTATGVLLRQQHFMVIDDTGKKLVQEACEPNADAASADQGVDDEKSVHYRHEATKMARWTQKYLQDLFLFTNATKVTLVLFGHSYPSHALRSYWDAPTELARRKVRQGEAPFERVLSRAAGPEMSHEILA